MKLTNSLTKKKEEFKPIVEKTIGIYTCGPTVYSYVTIGNWRTYVLGDVVFRAMKYLYPNSEVKYVMNITDVGHLTGDNLGDADTGEDRLEKAAKKEGKTAWDIAEFYAQDFVKGYKSLNLLWPTESKNRQRSEKTSFFTKATEHIEEQIKMVKEIETAGFSYRISDGIYFDTQAFEEAGNQYGKLSNIDQVKEGARVEPNPEKKDPRDFALWKFSAEGEKRHMEWKSPWGIGFPGWHIECSAMSREYLGDAFDIHLGGEDLKSTHHPNEIAQAEASGMDFVKYWIHGAFLQVDGGRMGKSLGNAYTLHDIEKRGFSPLDLKYFYYSAHYSKPLNFTWEALQSAKKAREKLKTQVSKLKNSEVELGARSLELREDFRRVVADDFNMPKALAVVWEVLGNKDLEDNQKYQLVMEFDQVLGLELGTLEIEVEEKVEVSDEVQTLLDKREELRSAKKYDEADAVRDKILEAGYEIEDTAEGAKLKKI